MNKLHPDSVSKEGIDFIAEFEGLRLRPYLCPGGVWTIGDGHTHGVTKDTPPITEVEAVKLLVEDVRWVVKVIHNSVAVALSKTQFDALASFIFNVGAGAFYKSTLLKRLNDGDYVGAASEFYRWVNGGGERLPGLIRRRAREVKLFRFGSYD